MLEKLARQTAAGVGMAGVWVWRAATKNDNAGVHATIPLLALQPPAPATLHSTARHYRLHLHFYYTPRATSACERTRLRGGRGVRSTSSPAPTSFSAAAARDTTRQPPVHHAATPLTFAYRVRFADA